MDTNTVVKPVKIAVVVDAVTQFNAIKNGLMGLSEKGIDFDLIIPAHNTQSPKILIDAFNYAKSQGFSPVSEPQDSHVYQILLEPYFTDHYFDDKPIPHNYRIRYSYGLVCTKPDPCLAPQYNLKHDAIIVHSKTQAEYHSAYLKTHLVGFPRYYGFSKKTDYSDKPNLLYLPTFGEVSSAKLIQDVTAQLRTKYNIMIKTHHALEYRSEESESFRAIKENADEFFGSNTPVESLLERADIVLSDNSGAVFDAIYTHTPVAILCPCLNKQNYKNIEPILCQLVSDDIIPYASDTSQLLSALERAPKLLDKQSALRTDFLLDESWENLVGGFVGVIEDYLKLDRSKDYYCMTHDHLRAEYYGYQAISFQEDNYKWRISQLEGELGWKNSQIEYFENSVSWRLTKPLRAVRKLLSRPNRTRQ